MRIFSTACDQPRHPALHPRILRMLHGETGAALVVALLLLTFLLAMIPVALRMTSQDLGRTANFEKVRQAFYVAEAGLQQGKANIKDNDVNDILSGPDNDPLATADNGCLVGVGTCDTVTFSDPYAVVTNVGSNNGGFFVRVTDNDDGDGDIWTDTDGVLQMVSVGSVSEAVKTVSAKVWKLRIPPANFPSAVTLVGPQSYISSQGSAFSVSGGVESPPGSSIYMGYDLSGNPDTSCPAKNGVTTESPGPAQNLTPSQNMSDCTEATCQKFSNNAEDGITGVNGGSPDMSYGQNDFTASQAQELWDTLTAPGVPETVSSDPSVIVNNSTNLILGSLTSPTIAHYQGNLRVNGGVEGHGVLIVDGDLDIQGTMNWNGIILVGACSTCPGALEGTGSATVRGAVLVGNALDATANFTGSANIEYSCEGIDVANGAFGFATRLLSWNEESTNPINP